MSVNEDKQQKTSQVTTDTTSTVHDIGLTGANAVQVVTAAENGSIAHQQIAANEFAKATDLVGTSYEQFVGAVGKQTDQYYNAINAGTNALFNTVAAQETALGTAYGKLGTSYQNLASTVANSNPGAASVKPAILIAAAALAAMVLVSARGKK